MMRWPGRDNQGNPIHADRRITYCIGLYGGNGDRAAHATIAPCCLSMLSSWTIYGADIALIAMALLKRAIFTGGGECQFMSDSRKLICGFIIDGKLQKPNLF